LRGALGALPSGRAGIVANVFIYPTRLLGTNRQRPGGLRYLIEFPGYSDGIFFAIFAGALVWSLWRLRSADLPRACLILFLTILLFLPGFSAQYLVWPIALGSLEAVPFYAFFSTVGALFYFGESRLLPWPVTVTALATWVAGLVWWIDEIRLLRFRVRSEVGPGVELRNGHS